MRAVTLPGSVVGRRGALLLGGLLLLLAGAVVVFLLLNEASGHFVAANSDGATVVLEGQSMQGGSPLLAGWALPLDSFFTIEVPLYAAAVALFGLRGDLVNAVPAAIATLVVIVTVVIAARHGRRWSKVAAVAVVLGFLALPSPALSFFLLQGPWHVGTALLCAVAFCGAASGRLDWRAGLATVALAAGLLGDVQTIALGVVPVLVGGLVAAARARSLRRAVPPTAIAVASVVLAYGARKVTDAIGTFTLVDANPTARLSQVGFNLRHLPSRFAGLLGVGTVPIGPGTTPSRLEPLHGVLLALLLVGIAAGTVSLVRGVVLGDQRTTTPVGSRSLDDLLLLGFVGDLGAFVLLAATGNGDYARYLTAGVIFAVVLVGRQCARLDHPVDPRALAAFAGVLLGCAALAFSLDLGLPAVSRPTDALGSFLAAHRLTSGIGDYWSASIVTASTGGSVTVRPVITTPAGTLARYGRQSTGAWYAGKRFEFLVYDLHHPWRSVGEASATATFGKPKEILAEGTYRIFVFSSPVSVSPIGYSNA